MSMNNQVVDDFVIKVDHLHFKYDDAMTPIINNASFELSEGGITAFMGQSGSGKSTLLYALSGIVPRVYQGECSGDIYFYGRNLKDMPQKELNSFVSFVFQDPETQLFSSTVEDEVAFGPENMGLDCEEIETRISRALEMVGLEEYRQFSPNELSGGQKQLVALASVLAMESPILFLDEPMAWLDEKSSKKFMQVMLDLKKSGKTILWVDHDESRVTIADRVFVLDNGNLYEKPKPESAINVEFETIIEYKIDSSNRLEKVVSNGFESPCIDNFENIYSNKIETKEPIYSNDIENKNHKTACGQRISEQCTDGQGINSGQSIIGGQHVVGEQCIGVQSNIYENRKNFFIETKNVSYKYPNTGFSCEEMDLKLYGGEITAIVGDNGSGKTTIGKLLAGLIHPEKGSVFFKGENISKISLGEIGKQIGYLFQEPKRQIFAPFVEEDLRFPMELKKVKKDEIDEKITMVLELFELANQRMSSAFHLSMGEKQRLALAGIWTTLPDYLILDEPTTGLDKARKDSLIKLLLSLKAKSGIGMTIITHDQALINQVSDRIITIFEGRVIKDEKV